MDLKTLGWSTQWEKIKNSKSHCSDNTTVVAEIPINTYHQSSCASCMFIKIDKTTETFLSINSGHETRTRGCKCFPYKQTYARCVSTSKMLYALQVVTVCQLMSSQAAVTLKLLQNFYPNLETRSDPASLAILSKVHAKYLQENNVQFFYPVLANLNSYITELSGGTNCFIVIDNFQNMNMRTLKFPIFLRSPVPYVVRIDDSLVYKYRITFGAKMVFQESNYTFANVTCQTSNFLAANLFRDYCLSVDFIKFSLLAKPTSCTIHLGIFPPGYITYLHHHFAYPQPFHFKHMHSSLFRHQAAPSSVPTINCVILPTQKNPSNQWSFATFRNWMKVVQDMLPHDYTHDIFVIVDITGKIAYRESAFLALDSYVNLSSAYVLKICPYCLEGNKFGLILKIQSQNLNRTLLAKLAFVTTSEMLIWENSVFLNGKNIIIDSMLQHAKAHNSGQFHQLWKQILANERLVEKIAIAHANAWKSVLRNFTFVADDCYGWRETHCRPNFVTNAGYLAYKKSLFVFPYYTTDVINILRFIGCGRQGMSSIPFQELTNVFDNKIWGFIVLASLTISALIRCSHRSVISSSQLIHIVKLLLEQGGPFAKSVLNAAHLRNMIGLLLLMGIILSNAYKNSNVYNMVIPRKPILYKFFRELVRDKFDIFSRPSTIIVYSTALQRPDFVKLKTKIANLETYLVSEVTSTLDNRNGIMKNLDQMESQMTLSSAVMNGTRMHTESIDIFSKHLLEKNFSGRIDWLEVLDEIDLNFTILQVMETDRLFRIVEECQKTAIVLPDHICKTLHSKSQVPEVFIGQETYTELDWMFYFSGLVPPHFIRGMHRIAESGVWTWWTHVFVGKNTRNANVNYVGAANMQGNVIIIFVLWGIGICLANLCYWLEHGKRIIENVTKEPVRSRN